MDIKNKLGVPKPDGDVVNKEPRVLLIGYGWVGQFCGKYFKTADIYTSEGFQKKEFQHYDLAIISVPTPMNQETGQCNYSIIEECVDKFKGSVDYFLTKSTVEIGTTDYLKEKYKVKIAMSPEYVGETLGHPLVEPRRDAFQIIGGEDETTTTIAGFWRTVLTAYAPILICTAIEAETIKYCENYRIMQAVDYWNDVYEICQTLGGKFDRVREGLTLDNRFTRTHSNVYPNNRGWAGKCLPKDMNALAYKMRKMGKPLTTLEHQIKKNATEWRVNYDNKGRLLPEKPTWI
jgi:UDPglucose 6-dehydrogenase